MKLYVAVKAVFTLHLTLSLFALLPIQSYGFLTLTPQANFPTRCLQGQKSLQDDKIFGNSSARQSFGSALGDSPASYPDTLGQVVDTLNGASEAEEALQREASSKRLTKAEALDEDIEEIKVIVEGKADDALIEELKEKLAIEEEKSLAEKRYFEGEISALEGTITKLGAAKEEELNAAQDELNAAKDELDAAKNKLHVAEGRMKEVVEGKEAESRKVAEESKKVGELAAEKHALEGKVLMIERETQDVIKNLELELGDMKASLSESEEKSKSEAAELRKEIKSLERSVGHVESVLRLSESKLTNAMDTISSLKAAAEEQAMQAQRNVEEIKKSLYDGFRLEREGLEAKLAAVMAELASLRVDYEGKLERKDAEIARLEEEVRLYKDQVFELDRDLEDANLSLDKVGVSKAQLESQVQQLNGVKAKLEGQIQELTNENSASVAAYEEKLAGVVGELEIKKVQLADYREELTNIDPLVKRLRTAVKKRTMARVERIRTGAKTRGERIKAGAKRRGDGIKKVIRNLRK